MDILSAERELNTTSTTKTTTNSTTDTRTTTTASTSSTSGSSLPYVELVVETDTDNLLPGYEATALTDPIVLQYTTAANTTSTGGENKGSGEGGADAGKFLFVFDSNKFIWKCVMLQRAC